MRRLELYELVDGGDPCLKAVRLLSQLSGPAWMQASESLSPKDLNCVEGMDIFKSFIRAHFQKYEVLQEAEVME